MPPINTFIICKKKQYPNTKRNGNRIAVTSACAAHAFEAPDPRRAGCICGWQTAMRYIRGSKNKNWKMYKTRWKKIEKKIIIKNHEIKKTGQHLETGAGGGHRTAAGRRWTNSRSICRYCMCVFQDSDFLAVSCMNRWVFVLFEKLCFFYCYWNVIKFRKLLGVECVFFESRMCALLCARIVDWR